MAIKEMKWTVSTKVSWKDLSVEEMEWTYGDFWGGFAEAPGTPYTIVWGGLAQLPAHASAASNAVTHLRGIITRLEGGEKDVYGRPPAAQTIEGLQELLEHLQS